MKWVRTALLAAATAVPLSGCGTVRNLASGNPDNFGGVQRDLQVASDASSHGGLLSGQAGSYGGGGQGEAIGAAFFLALWGADLTLSAVGDTATLPLVTYLRHKQEAATGGEAAVDH